MAVLLFIPIEDNSHPYDNRHGTGHGVGHFLNVHEGPHGIGTRISAPPTPFFFLIEN